MFFFFFHVSIYPFISNSIYIMNSLLSFNMYLLQRLILILNSTFYAKAKAKGDKSQ